MQLLIFQFFLYSLFWQLCFSAYSVGTDPLNEMPKMIQAESSSSPLIQLAVETGFNRERKEKDRAVRNLVKETFKWELTKLTEEEKIFYDYMEAYSTEVSTICKLVQGECLIITDKDQQECKYVTQRCFFQNVKHCFQNKTLINPSNASVTVQVEDKSFVFKRKSEEDTSAKKMEKDRILRNLVKETFKWELTKLTKEEKPLYDNLEACSTEVNKICSLVQGECLIITDKDQQECRYVTQRCFFQNVRHCLESKNLINPL